MKCLFHISANQYPPFPAKHHTLRIWEELSKDCDEYHVFARSEGMRYIHSSDGKIHLHLLPTMGTRMWGFFFSSWALPFFVKRYKATHMIAQCPVLGGLAAAFCSKVFKIPLLVEIHGENYFKPLGNGLEGLIEFYVTRFFSKMVFRSASTIRSLAEDMTDIVVGTYEGVDRAKVKTVPTRVDLSVFSKIKTDYRIGENLHIVSVGSFCDRKNYANLLKDLYATKISFTLTLVGSGPSEGTYLNLAKELGISNRLVIASRLGHRELSDLLPSQDIYIQYSRSEGLPRAILEAMAVGLPVITTPVGYIGNLVSDKLNGIILADPWQDSLAKALDELAKSEDMRMKLGQAARKKIVAEYEWEKVFRRYRSVINGMSLNKAE